MRMKKWLQSAGKVFFSLTLALLVIGIFSIVAAGVFVGAVLDTSLDESLLLSKGTDHTTRLYCYDREGNAHELCEDRISGYENALWCPFEEISPYLVQAFIAIEDKRFFEHSGIDWRRTASAVLDYCRGGEGHFGGSTITQQLIKNVTGDTERSARRKVAELLRAVKLEKRLRKEEILEQYLNIVNLSQNCYGVRTAANAYFSKEPSALSLREAATLAAITNNPAKYDPIRHADANRSRRDVILAQMYAQNMITKAEYDAAVAEDTLLCVNEATLSGRVNSWYADMVVNDVIAALIETHGMSEREASRLVYGGGLRIYVAMDYEMQRIVQEYYENSDHFPTHENGEKAQSALMIVDPSSGDILAVAGAIGKKGSNRIQNFACDAKRPSGSVIKPLSVYAPAIDKGLITYATVFDDVPISFREDGAPWPKNAPNLYRGLTTVNTALRQSVNTVCVRVLERLGNDASYRFLSEKLGFSSLDEKTDIGAAALALGQQHNGVTLREIVGGYTALANGGIYTGTRSFYKVIDSSGNLLLENAGATKRVLKEADAAILTQMLRGAIQDGTGSSLKLKQIVDVAGKTGTSGKNYDKWFVGYTPSLLCGVWYGHEYPASLYDVSGNPALRIFDAVMQNVIERSGGKEERFVIPSDVVVVRYCKDSGCLPTEACALDPRGHRTEYGYFRRGTEPRSYCTCHTCIEYCDEGGVATKFCPETSCRRVALLRVSRHFPRQIKIEDAPYTMEGAVPYMEHYDACDAPYYTVLDETKRHCGIGLGVVPFNRLCPAHLEEENFWDHRSDIDLVE